MTTTSFYVDAQNLIRSVDIVFQVFAKAGYLHDGLFPAVTERQNGNLLMDMPLPPPIPGQRNSDRSPRGCNSVMIFRCLPPLMAWGMNQGKMLMAIALCANSTYRPLLRSVPRPAPLAYCLWVNIPTGIYIYRPIELAIFYSMASGLWTLEFPPITS